MPCSCRSFSTRSSWSSETLMYGPDLSAVKTWIGFWVAVSIMAVSSSRPHHPALAFYLARHPIHNRTLAPSALLVPDNPPVVEVEHLVGIGHQPRVVRHHQHQRVVGPRLGL